MLLNQKRINAANNLLLICIPRATHAVYTGSNMEERTLLPQREQKHLIKHQYNVAGPMMRLCDYKIATFFISYNLLRHCCCYMVFD